MEQLSQRIMEKVAARMLIAAALAEIEPLGNSARESTTVTEETGAVVASSSSSTSSASFPA